MDNNEGGSNINIGHNTGSNDRCSNNGSNSNTSNINNSSSNNNDNSSSGGGSNSSNSSSFKATFFASSPYLVSLAAFVRKQLLVGRGDRDESPPFAAEGKPAALTSLSPEVLDRLLYVNREASARAEREQPGKGLSSTTAAATSSVVTAASPARSDIHEYEVAFLEQESIVHEDGSIDWRRVGIAPNSEGDEATLAEGARLAALCHGALQRQRQESSSQAQGMGERLEKAVSESSRLPFPAALAGVAERIVRAPPPFSSSAASDKEKKEGAATEEVYVALCVCLAVLERALYDIHRGGNRKPGVPYRPSANVDDTGAATITVEGVKGDAIGDSHSISNAAGGGGSGVGDEYRGGEAVRPAMILRDLIATPEVKAALPEQMVAVLRLLLLPLGFNVRNLVVR